MDEEIWRDEYPTIEVLDLQCCGLQELHGISDEDPEDVIYSIICRAYTPPRPPMVFNRKKAMYEPNPNFPLTPARWSLPAFFIFTQAIECASQPFYGETLQRFITRNKLGKVTKSEPRENPNTTNMVTVFVWHIDREGFEVYRKKKEEKK